MSRLRKKVKRLRRNDFVTPFNESFYISSLGGWFTRYINNALAEGECLLQEFKVTSFYGGSMMRENGRGKCESSENRQCIPKKNSAFSILFRTALVLAPSNPSRLISIPITFENFFGCRKTEKPTAAISINQRRTNLWVCLLDNIIDQ